MYDGRELPPTIAFATVLCFAYFRPKLAELKKIVFLTIAICTLVTSCAPSRIIKPLDEGEQVISLSLGGPMTAVPGIGTIPVPFTNISYNRGWKHNITLTGSIYPTAALFGTYQFDLGLNYGFVKKDNWGVSSTILFNNAFDQWQGNYKIWPNLDVNGYYELKKEDKSWLFYTGFNNWFELASAGVHGREQNVHWIFAPQLGVQLIKEKWSYQLEYKLIGPNLNNQNFVVSYSSILPQTGANGIYLGISRRF